MKESIDLTEHRDFRDNGTKSPVVYYHKVLPWVTAGDFELAERRRGGSLKYSNSNSLSWNDETRITWSSFFTNGWNTSSEWITSSSNNHRDRIFYSTFSNDMISYTMNDEEVTISFDGDYMRATKKIDYQDFPVGTRDYINAHRRPIPEVEQSKYITKQCYCRKCRNKIPRTPWNNNFSFNPLCEDCNKLEVEPLAKRFQSIKPGKRNRYGAFNNDIYGSVPCLSRRIPMEKREKQIPKRFIEWHDLYMEDFIYDFFKRPNPDSIREKAVYYKNRELRRREEPWQPKGRVAQDYDILFEDTDWRDMLKKRIGVLDRDSILSKKSSHDNIIRLNTTFNFNDLFITI